MWNWCKEKVKTKYIYVINSRCTSNSRIRSVFVCFQTFNMESEADKYHYGEDGQFLHSAFSLLLCFEKWWGLNGLWPCVAAPGEAGVWMRAGSLSVVLLRGVCSSATWRSAQLSQEANVSHMHTNISQPSENHTVLSKPGGRTIGEQVRGVLITPHSRWAPSHFLRPPPKKKKTKKTKTCAL